MALKGSTADGKKQDVADGLRKASTLQPQSSFLKVWSDLANGGMSFADFGERMLHRNELTFLTIDTTGACDLKCEGMCYYHPKIDLRKLFVPEESLKQAILDSIEKLNLKSLVFAGKEPLLNSKLLFNLLDFAGPRENRDFQTGIVTNGRRIHSFWTEIQDLVERGCLDYIDVSIDSGFADQHDQIRGAKGTFDLAFATTKKIADCFPEVRLTIPSVLRPDNREGILELIKIASGHVKNFQIQPFQPPPYSDFEPHHADFIIEFLHALEDFLVRKLGGRGIEVSVELLGIYQMEAVNAGFFAWHELREDINGNIFVERQVSGNSLILTCDTMPLQCSRLARITYEGAYLAHMHFLQTPSRELFLVGYIQDEPITELFQKSLTSGSHFQRILESRLTHDCRHRPCWNNCFGGWNGSENAFLTNHSLTLQPRLCTKAEQDYVRLLT